MRGAARPALRRRIREAAPYVFSRRETRTVAHERSVTAKLRECAERRARLERVSAAIAEVLEAEVALHAVLASAHSTDVDVVVAERAVRDLAFRAELVQRQGLRLEDDEVHPPDEARSPRSR